MEPLTDKEVQEVAGKMTVTLLCPQKSFGQEVAELGFKAGSVSDSKAHASHNFSTLLFQIGSLSSHQNIRYRLCGS